MMKQEGENRAPRQKNRDFPFLVGYKREIAKIYRVFLVPKAGFEPARGNPHTPLKRACLPFHHFGTYSSDYETSCCPCQRITSRVELSATLIGLLNLVLT